MTPFELLLLVIGAATGLVIILQNVVYSQPTRREHEDHLRERLIGKGDREGPIMVKISDLRVTHLNWWEKLQWSLRQGLNTSTEVYVTSNAEIEDDLWDEISRVMEVEIDVEHLKTERIPNGQVRSALRIDSSDEKDIMMAVTLIPKILDKMDVSMEPEVAGGGMDFEGMVERLQD
ncbi:hypothetical protein [Natrarchaeobaculum sulfurireducens]|uniref:hypothetical protein n=1 Tax=Natrarchaeobaculum sulfurireducens TaxID=2044521 RepID=UPI000E3E3A90|nr:hypothetical protein [Natrarchaeobaculum sulfurireducens]